MSGIFQDDPWKYCSNLDYATFSISLNADSLPVGATRYYFESIQAYDVYGCMPFNSFQDQNMEPVVSKNEQYDYKIWETSICNMSTRFGIRPSLQSLTIGTWKS